VIKHQIRLIFCISCIHKTLLCRNLQPDKYIIAELIQALTSNTDLYATE